MTLRAPSCPGSPGSTYVDSRGDRHVVYVEDADAFVASLVRSRRLVPGARGRRRSSLEDAFVTLTGEGAA